MSEFLFLGTILGANAGLLALAVRIVGDERAEYHERIAALSLDRRSQPCSNRSGKPA